MIFNYEIIGDVVCYFELLDTIINHWKYLETIMTELKDKTPEGKIARIDISKKWAKQVVKGIPRLRYNSNNWIVQDECGSIFIMFGDAKLVRFEPNYFWEWIPINGTIGSIHICNPIKGKTIKTFRQAKAQLTIDHWWIDSRGRLIVQDRNVPDSLKAQA